MSRSNRPDTPQTGMHRAYASTVAVLLALVFAVLAAWLLTGVNRGTLPERLPLGLGPASEESGAEAPTADAGDGEIETLSETRPLRQ